MKIPCDGRVDDCVQFCECLGIGKHDVCQRLAVNVNESTVLIASACFSESVHNPRTQISMALVERLGPSIGVENWNAKALQNSRNGGFSATNSPRQAHNGQKVG